MTYDIHMTMCIKMKTILMEHEGDESLNIIVW